ncbi:MAG: DUF6252 family protein [Bacteroidia bacterium]
MADIGVNKIILKSAILIFTVAALFSSCGKNGVETLTPLSSYNMNGYANSQVITFNAAATDYYDTLDIYGTWNSNINYTYILNMRNIKLLKKYVGTYSLNSGAAIYAAYPTGSNPPSYLFNYTSYSGTMSIYKYDSIHRIISGTFSFNGTYAGESINISNGQFSNVKLTP